MRAKEVDDWAMYNQVTLKHKALHQTVWLVERHNALIRSALQSAESQAIKESSCASFIIAFVLVNFMHDVWACMGNRIPYQALFGRQPNLFPPFEEGYYGDLDVGGQNDLARVREIAAVARIQATAKQHWQRGDHHRQIVVQERAEHQPGDLVDIWCDPLNKDTPARRGPAQIASVNFGEGNVTVRSQGRDIG